VLGEHEHVGCLWTIYGLRGIWDVFAGIDVSNNTYHGFSVGSPLGLKSLYSHIMFCRKHVESKELSCWCSIPTNGVVQ
jgi:hypothetical protein